MAKKLVSAKPHKKKPIKTITKRKHLKSVFKKFFNYMKSDTFMYAPLIPSPHSHSYLAFLPPPFDEAIKRSDANYLKSDCYMYAPLVKSNYDTAKGKKMEARWKQEEMTGDNCSYNPVRRVVLHGTMLHKETVMQIVHQNCHPSSV